MIDLHDRLHPIPEIIPERPWSLAAHLAYGVTTGLDPSADSKAVFTYAEMVEAGELLGQRIYSTGSALNVRAAKIESLDDAREIVRRYKKHGAISLKEYLQPRRIQRQWLMMAAQEEGLLATADGGGHLAFDLTHVLDGYTGFEHNMPPVPVYKDVIELLARARTYYSPTLGVELVGPRGYRYFRQTMDLHEDAKLRRFTPHEEIDRDTRRRLLVVEDDFRFVQAAKVAAQLVRKGGYAVLGGHGEQQGLATHWELWTFVMGGLTPLEALRAGTLYGAECLGLQEDLGSLEPGKLADLVVLNKRSSRATRAAATMSARRGLGAADDGAQLREGDLHLQQRTVGAGLPRGVCHPSRGGRARAPNQTHEEPPLDRAVGSSVPINIGMVDCSTQSRPTIYLHQCLPRFPLPLQPVTPSEKRTAATAPDATIAALVMVGPSSGVSK